MMFGWGFFADWGHLFPVYAMPGFMPGFRKFKVVAGGNAGKPMGLLLALTYAS